MRYRIRKHTYLLPQDDNPHHYFTVEERWFLLWGRSIDATFSSEESALKYIEWSIEWSKTPEPVVVREIDTRSSTARPAYRSLLVKFSTADPVLLVVLGMIATLAFVAYTLSSQQGGITTTVYPILSGR